MKLYFQKHLYKFKKLNKSINISTWIWPLISNFLQVINDPSFPYTRHLDLPYTHDKTTPYQLAAPCPSTKDHNAHATHWPDTCHRPTTHPLLTSSRNCSTRSRGLPRRHLNRHRCCQRSFLKSKPFARFRIFGRCMCSIRRFCGSWGSWRSWRSSLLGRGGRNCVCRGVLSVAKCRINISNMLFTILSTFLISLPYIQTIGCSDRKCLKTSCSSVCSFDLTQR